MSDADKRTIGWQVSETYAIVRRIEKRLWPYDEYPETSWPLENQPQDIESLVEPLKERVQELQAKLAETAHLPNLGLATTEEMFRELISRFTVGAESLFHINTAVALAEILGGLGALEKEYRTVDDHG